MGREQRETTAQEREVNRDDLAGRDAEPVPDADATPDFAEGRYVYCVVTLESGEADLDVEGIDDEPVSVVALERDDRDRDKDGGSDRDGDRNATLAAVVHACDSLYDSADLAQVKRWLVRHQTVIDRASQRFGTPLPFQFDTIVRGDDDAVRGWLADQRAQLESALADLAGHAEYRIEVVETDPPDEETLIERDDELASLAEEREAASEGRAFLLEKQFDQRIRDLRRDRRASIRESLRQSLESCTREVQVLDRQPSVSLSSASSGSGGAGKPTDGTRLCRLTVLARESEEETIGSVLDDVAEKPGLEVRFTGPWPPYSFAPTLGEETDAAAGGGQPGSTETRTQSETETQTGDPQR
ncbi:gas vesicle protein GvpL [Natronosalvus halobius]|uniref:gas vesicle protein GvpL n=1 Tax=Natronosalvus halobius TaxID=2953746 RepID=UPI0020A076B5|nr:GvpL/GvpF family gas vesicle protein [Natronosalvus halobius]USZ73262.1 GvpL/GvpF family gas vesicle protein [Natronosalvus halobius]